VTYFVTKNVSKCVHVLGGKIMSKVISITNNKGGVAKTTTTLNIAVALTKLGKKVLMIDLDPQASLSVNFGINPLDKMISINNVLTEDVSLEETTCATHIENLWIVTSGIELSRAEFTIINKMGREYILKNKIKALEEDYDYIIIDNSPSLGILTINSLMAADYVIAPTDPTFFALKGLEILTSTLEEVKEWNKKLEFLGVVVTMYDGRTKHHNEVVAALKNRYPVFDSLIKRSIKFPDACLNMSSIFETEGDNFEGAQAYMNIAKEIVNHE
jgi:chromosome partitioning protein